MHITTLNIFSNRNRNRNAVPENEKNKPSAFTCTRRGKNHSEMGRKRCL